MILWKLFGVFNSLTCIPVMLTRCTSMTLAVNLVELAELVIALKKLCNTRWNRPRQILHIRMDLAKCSHESIADKCCLKEKDHESPLHLHIHHVSALWLAAGEGMHGDDHSGAVDERASSLECLCFANILYHLTTDGTTNEEHNMKGSFTYHKLIHLSNSVECSSKQLDDHHDVPPFGDPVLCHSIKSPNILCLHWNNIVKPSGVYKCWCCMDTSKRVCHGCDCSCRCYPALGNSSHDYSPLCVLSCALSSPVVNCS